MKKKKTNITLVILAAGASSRMGSPKQLLPWGENTLLEYMIYTSQKTKASKVVVVLGANYDIIVKEIISLPVTITQNKEWELGLGKSIAHAASFILDSKEKTDGVLFMLADQPFIDSYFLNEIIDAFQAGNHLIIGTSYEKEKVGVPVLFDEHYLEELSELSHDNGAKSILKKYHNNIQVLNPKIKNLDIDSYNDYIELFNSV